jgi:acyl-CoA synthetase (NDP forming)
MVVIFGSPGLFPVDDVYALLDEKMKHCTKPVFPVLPSVINVQKEIGEFLARGHVNFPDEVVLGRALSRIRNTPDPIEPGQYATVTDRDELGWIARASAGRYLSPDDTRKFLDAAGIPRVPEEVAGTAEEALIMAERLGFPLVMKVVGPLHKSDVGGVVLDIRDPEQLGRQYSRLMGIRDAEAVLLQPMLSGIELFAGIRREEKFGHLVMCGMGGILVEALGDVSTGLAPLAEEEALSMIRNLKAFPVLEGVRGQQGIDISMYATVLLRLCGLVGAVPEITEMDLNPLLGTGEQITAVDARIRIG